MIRCLPPSPPPLLRQGRLLTQVHCWIHSSLNPPPSEVTAVFDQACLLLGCWGSKLGSSDRGSRLLTDCAVPQTRIWLLTRCASCRSDAAAPWLKNTLELFAALNPFLWRERRSSFSYEAGLTVSFSQGQARPIHLREDMVYLGSSSPLKVPGPADSRLQALLLPTKLTAKITFPSVFSPFPLPPSQDLCFKVIINIKLGVFFPLGEKILYSTKGGRAWVDLTRRWELMQVALFYVIVSPG